MRSNFQGGEGWEEEELQDAYKNALRLAFAENCHSIGFPLISAGIFGMPVDIAWKCAIKACLEFKADYPDYKLDILFAVRREEIKKVGIAELKRQVQGCGYCGDRGDTGDR